MVRTDLYIDMDGVIKMIMGAWSQAKPLVVPALGEIRGAQRCREN